MLRLISYIFSVWENVNQICLYQVCTKQKNTKTCSGFRQADGTFSREGLEFAVVEETFCELLTFSVWSSDTNSIDQRQFLLFGNALSCPEEDEPMANHRSGGGSRVLHIRSKHIQSHSDFYFFIFYSFCV